MTELNRASLANYIRSVGVRQIRLACGLVLFCYLLSHFINHALGNISQEALATGVRYHIAFWKSLPIATVFYADRAGPRSGRCPSFRRTRRYGATPSRVLGQFCAYISIGKIRGSWPSRVAAAMRTRHTKFHCGRCRTQSEIAMIRFEGFRQFDPRQTGRDAGGDRARVVPVALLRDNAAVPSLLHRQGYVCSHHGR
jgi:hypothetical protein